MKFIVFISEHCPSCAEAIAIAWKVRQLYPDIEVETFNVDAAQPGPEVFAVPTYMLDDRVVFLGNPTDKQIEDLFEGIGQAS